MSTVLVCSIAANGQTLPLLGVARGLIDRGHRVVWLSPAALAPCVEALDVEKLVVGNPASYKTPAVIEDLAAFVHNEVLQRGIVRGLVIDWIVDRLDKCRAIIRRIAPDLVVAGSMVGAPAVAACMEGVPMLSVWLNLALFADERSGWDRIKLLDELEGEREQLHGEWGIPHWPRSLGVVSPQANAVLTVRELVEEQGALPALPPNTRLVGPVRHDYSTPSDFPWEQLAPERPLVYAAFGAGGGLFEPKDLLDKIYRAVAPMPVQLVSVDSRAEDAQWREHLPSNVLAVPFAPQLELLDRARVFFTHGGYGSVSEALDRGVPIIVCPVRRDQPLQAYFVGRWGCGVALDTWTTTTAQLRATLDGVLSPSSVHAQQAKRYQQAMNAKRGTEEMLAWAEELLSR